MIEGQQGVTWEQWQAIAAACERSGIHALFRSDHYLPHGDDRSLDVLDAWAVICGLAAITTDIRLGTLVSPVGFRHPSLLAKMVATADAISGGRIELGLGIGWNEAEHRAFGFDFTSAGLRIEALTEQLEILHGLWAGESFSFSGEHYALDAPPVLPTPVQKPQVPIMIGGQAGPKSAALAARWAGEYNTFYATPNVFRTRRRRVLDAVQQAGRDPESMRFSLMTGAIVGRDDDEVQRRRDRLRAEHGQVPDESWIVGTPEAAGAQLRALADAGVERVMLQLMLHAETEQIDLIGSTLVDLGT